MRLLLVSRIDNPDAIAYSRKVKDILEEDGVEVSFDSDTATILGETGLPLADTAADIVVVVGGDGTILRTIQQMLRPVPVIGINRGEVGFLADIDPTEAIEFVRTLSRGFSVEERMRITLLKDGIRLGTALNEALIVTTRPAKMLRFSILVDGITLSLIHI